MFTQVTERMYDNVLLQVYPNRAQMGEAAARDAAECIRTLLKTHEQINCIFAAAPSQNEFLAALLRQEIEWGRINAYHMDEYVGFELGHPKSFNHFLSESIFDRVPFRSVHLINGANDPDEETRRYGALLDAAPTHITFMGIGENGHIAFNDPPAADFQDAVPIKKVRLDEVCRAQQVHDGCFASLDEVPRYALTVTVPRLAASEHIFCIVPAASKHKATVAALTGPISEACPASILRRTDNVRMYIDEDCAGDLI